MKSQTIQKKAYAYIQKNQGRKQTPEWIPHLQKTQKQLNDKDVHRGYGGRIKHMETKEKQPRTIRNE